MITTSIVPKGRTQQGESQNSARFFYIIFLHNIHMQFSIVPLLSLFVTRSLIWLLLVVVVFLLF